MDARSALLALVVATGCAGVPPALPPLAPGAFVAACPESPNCVSTAAAADDVEHHAAPLSFSGAADAAQARMKALVLAMPRTALVEEAPGSLQFTFTSRLMRFVDDVHLVFVAAPEGGGRVEYRSASRVGRGDMGVNRARMAAIAEAWTAGAPPR